MGWRYTPLTISARWRYATPSISSTSGSNCGAAAEAMRKAASNWAIAGSNVNITGSPDYAGKVVLGNNFGTGCSGNPFAEFNGSAVKGPSYGSVGLESGRNYLRGCPIDNVDTSIVRRFRFWKFQEARRFEFRADIFNTLNAVIYNGYSTTATFNNPTAMVLQNSQSIPRVP